MYNLHEECLVVAEDIEDLVPKLGCDLELLGMRRCVSGQDNAKVSGKQALEVAGPWIEVDWSGVDWVEAAKVETAVDAVDNRQRHSGNVAGIRRGVRIDWT
jgi:hypothetical protein